MGEIGYGAVSEGTPSRCGRDDGEDKAEHETNEDSHCEGFEYGILLTRFERGKEENVWRITIFVIQRTASAEYYIYYIYYIYYRNQGPYNRDLLNPDDFERGKWKWNEIEMAPTVVWLPHEA